MHDLKLPLLSIGVTLNHAFCNISGLGSLDCFVVIKYTKFGQLILMKIIKIVATQISDFKAKMHQIRFRLGLRPRPRWVSLQCSPRPPSWI